MENIKGSWVPLSTGDLQQVDRIATVIHPGLAEKIEIFAEKMALFPSGCMKFILPEGNMAGYGIAHPWKLFSIPPLDCLLEALPIAPDCLYMHDIALLPEARGHKASGRFVEKIRMIAQELDVTKLACVSVYGTNRLWENYGFRIEDVAEIGDKLVTYGATAHYMTANV